MDESTVYREELVRDYLNGNLSKNDVQNLFEWVNSSDENRMFYDGCLQVWEYENFNKLKNSYSGESSWKQFCSKYLNKKSKFIRITNYTIRIASVLLLFLAISYFTVYNRFPWSELKAPEYVTHIVPKGQISHLQLSDGTKIWLNAGSKLSYSLSKSEKRRRVKLEGEAYLEVAKDLENKFEVLTRDVNIEVLGTKFNVNTMGTYNRTVTTLYSGSVRLNTKTNQSTVLNPGSQAIYFPGKNKLVVKRTNIDKINSWIFNEFYFNNERLKNLVSRFERKYNINIKLLDKKCGNYRISGSFKDETIKEIMDNMRFIIPIEYSIKNNTITIKSRNSENKRGK